MLRKIKTINKLQVVQEIFEILARKKGHISIKDITKKINNKYMGDELETSEINVKRYIKDIQKYMGYILDVKKGRDGGYSLHESDWKFLSNISNQRLSAEEKNALNDAFEIARKSSTYYYVGKMRINKNHITKKITDFSNYLISNYLNYNFKNEIIMEK